MRLTDLLLALMLSGCSVPCRAASAPRPKAELQAKACATRQNLCNAKRWSAGHFRDLGEVGGDGIFLRRALAPHVALVQKINTANDRYMTAASHQRAHIDYVDFCAGNTAK